MKTVAGLILVIVVLLGLFSDKFADAWFRLAGVVFGTIVVLTLVLYGLSLVFGG